VPSGLDEGGSMTVARHIDEGAVAQAALRDIGSEPGARLPDRGILKGTSLRDVGVVEGPASPVLINMCGVTPSGLVHIRLDHVATLNDAGVVPPATGLIDEGPLAGARRTDVERPAAIAATLVDIDTAGTCCLIDLSTAIIDAVLLNGDGIEAARGVHRRPHTVTAGLLDRVVVARTRCGDAGLDVRALIVVLVDRRRTEVARLFDIGSGSNGGAWGVSQGDAQCQCRKFHVHGNAPLEFLFSALRADEMAPHGRPLPHVMQPVAPGVRGSRIVLPREAGRGRQDDGCADPPPESGDNSVETAPRAVCCTTS